MTNKVQKTINRNNYERYIEIKETRAESKDTQIFENNIKTNDVGLVAYLLIKNHEVSKIPNDTKAWSIQKMNHTDKTYEDYRNKKLLVEPKVFSKTLIQLLANEDNNYA